MSKLMLAQMGLAAVSSFTSYRAERSRAKMENMYREYSNVMQGLARARASNMSTLNKVRIRDAGIAEEEAIQLQSLVLQGQANARAGAAGTSGNSTALVMRDILASAARAQYNRSERVKTSWLSENYRRLEGDIQSIQSRNTRVIPKPSPFSAMLGLGTNLLNIWDSHQPPGEKMADKLS